MMVHSTQSALHMLSWSSAWEVHQDGDMRSPSAGAVWRCFSGVKSRDNRVAHVQQCQTGLRPPPDERNHTLGAALRCLAVCGVKGDETGFYAVKVKARCANALRAQP